MLKRAIGTFQPYKSPGLDGISPAFLQQGQGKLLTKAIITKLAQVNIHHAKAALHYLRPAYLAGDAPCLPLEIVRLVNYCRREKLPLLIGCDANAHRDIWGSSDKNQRGECLLEFIINSKQEIGNVGTTPILVTRVRDKVLDVTLISRSLKPYFIDWHVSLEESMSDHRNILFKLQANKDCSKPTRNPRKANWEKYSTTLERNIAGIYPDCPQS